MNALYWEDVVIGTRRDLGSYTFTEEEIIRFGQKYDPQTFHIDPEAAKHSIVRRLDRERMAHGGDLDETRHRRTQKPSKGTAPLRAGVSPGFEDMRWLKPVRPGMTLITRPK